MSILDTDRDKRLKLSLEKNGKTEQDLKDNIQIIREWMKTQKHLPEIADDAMIGNFIFMNNFSIENAKQKIDMYYTVRTLMPEFFENKNPKLPHMKMMQDDIIVVTLPKVTDEGNRISIIKGISTNSDQFDAANYFAHCLSFTELRLHEDVGIGDVIVYDLENFTMGHLVKMTPSAVRKASLILEKVYNSKVKQIHFVNPPPYFEGLMSLLKQFLKPKLVKRIHTHVSKDSLKDIISPKVLPKDMGGEEATLKEIYDAWLQKLRDNQARFDALDKMKTNEDLRPTPLVNDEVLGFYGNFKKLNVD